MRTSLGDHLRVLRRPAALAALAAAAGGVVAALAPRMALWRLTARVQALDTVGEQPVAVLGGSAASPLTWGVAAVGAAVVVLAVLVAADRPPPHPEVLLVGAGVLMVAAVGVLLVTRPSTDAFAGRPGAAELIDGEVPLPTGVGIELGVEPAMGMWVLAAAGLLVVAGSMVALRRG